MEPHRPALVLGALLGGTAVVLGALGSHTLFDEGSAAKLVNAWDVGVRYQAWHALALLALASLGPRFAGGALLWCFGLGVVAFSGSLYGLALEALPSGLGLITPLGGLLLIAGWVLLLVRSLRGGAQQ